MAFRQFGAKGARPAKKGDGSIVFGIQWLHNWKIIIDISCKELILEFKAYKWLLDKFGESTGKPEDKHNHGIDALRYALENYMRANRGMIEQKHLSF